MLYAVEVIQPELASAVTKLVEFMFHSIRYGTACMPADASVAPYGVTEIADEVTVP